MAKASVRHVRSFKTIYVDILISNGLYIHIFNDPLATCSDTLIFPPNSPFQRSQPSNLHALTRRAFAFAIAKHIKFPYLYYRNSSKLLFPGFEVKPSECTLPKLCKLSSGHDSAQQSGTYHHGFRAASCGRKRRKGLISRANGRIRFLAGSERPRFAWSCLEKISGLIKILRKPLSFIPNLTCIPCKELI